MTEEQTPKCSLCKSEMTDNARTATYYCANDDCAMRWEDLTREAVDALNTRLAEAARLRNGLHEFLEDLEHHDIYAETITLRAAIQRIEEILGTAKGADESGENHES